MIKRRMSKAERFSRAVFKESERQFRAMWKAEGRSLADYKAGIDNHDDDVWEWRRAKGRESIEREKQAWAADHPGRDADFYDYVTSCAVDNSPTGEADLAEFIEWERSRVGKTAERAQ